jgi:hypothetical protein
MVMQHVKCSKCGYVGAESEFPKGYDFFQNSYIASCPKKCGNTQSPGGASMRMFEGKKPFEFVRADEPTNPLAATLHRASEAS